MPKKVFLEIVVNAMEQLNECGQKCLVEPKKFFIEIVVNFNSLLNDYGKKCLEEMEECTIYRSLLYFEKSNLYFKKFIGGYKKIIINMRETNL